jgi:plastocyanin
MRNRLSARLLVILVGVLMVAALTPTVLAADRGIRIQDFAFGPRTVTITAGDRVTWTNRDSVEHTATARNGSFDTGLLGQGESRSMRFSVAGTYRYVCTPHPTMTGTIVVRAASSGGLQPPNTDKAAVPDAAPSGDAPTAALAVIGGLAYLVALRAFRRRRETA